MVGSLFISIQNQSILNAFTIPIALSSAGSVEQLFRMPSGLLKGLFSIPILVSWLIK